jgi:hypothetical protein
VLHGERVNLVGHRRHVREQALDGAQLRRGVVARQLRGEQRRKIERAEAGERRLERQLVGARRQVMVRDQRHALGALVERRRRLAQRLEVASTPRRPSATLQRQIIIISVQ